MLTEHLQGIDIEKNLLLLADRMEGSFFWIRDVTLTQQVYLSPSFDRIWGISREAIFANPTRWVESVFEEDRAHHNAEKMQTEFKHKGKDTKYNATYRIYWPDGSVRWLQDISFPLYNEKGTCVGFAGIVNDITDIKAYEISLKAAIQKTEETSQLKTDFIQNMQHDMRTPIVGLYGILEMLMETKNYEEISRLIPIAAESTKALLALCNEVVDFESIEYGQYSVASKSINIRELASQVINLNRSAARHKGIALLLIVADELPDFVNGDSYRLKKILTNLISNSIKFTKEGEVKLAIYPVSTNRDDMRICFEVYDTGIGIPENKKAVIFEKFVRLNPANREIYKGLGLGLSYVKKFVSELSGEIEVKSTLGVGTTFYLTFPFKVNSSPQKIRQTQPMTDDQLSNSFDKISAKQEGAILPLHFPLVNISAAANKQNYPILLIEDDVLACIVAKSLFERTGNSITTAPDVSTAKKILDSMKFYLVVSDIGLPDGTGFDVITYIKRNKSSINYTTPFLALTAHNDKEKISQAKKCGFLKVLTKPLTQELVSDLVNVYLSNIGESTLLSGANQQDAKNVIIDLEATMNLINANRESALEVLELLAHSIQEEGVLLREAYRKNDLLNTRKSLHKLKGGLSYCSVPRLKRVIEELHEEVKKSKQLSSLEGLYHRFYEEIAVFIHELDHSNFCQKEY